MLEYLLLNRSWAHWQISSLVRCAPFTKSACDSEIESENKLCEYSFKRDLNADAPKLYTILECLKEWTQIEGAKHVAGAGANGQKFNRSEIKNSRIPDKCKVTEDTTAHAFWFCPSLSGFWTSIFDWYSKAYNRPLLLDAELAIFGFSQHTSSVPKTLQQVLILAMIVAKRLL